MRRWKQSGTVDVFETDDGGCKLAIDLTSVTAMLWFASGGMLQVGTVGGMIHIAPILTDPDFTRLIFEAWAGTDGLEPQ